MHAKALIFDLDRTLLRSDKTLSPYTRSVLRACKEQAIRLMAATARPLRDTLPYDEIIGFDAMTVSNGARILCKTQTKEFAIAPESADRILRRLSQNPSLLITLETGDRAYSNRPVDEYETTVCPDLADRAKAEGALKILVRLDGTDTRNAVTELLTDDLYYTVANGHLLQIMSRFATKWNGVQKMLKISGLTAAEAVYFGDDYDDIEPLRLCGTGVAVANAIPEAKAAANCIAEGNDEDGVARFIERVLLQK